MLFQEKIAFFSLETFFHKNEKAQSMAEVAGRLVLVETSNEVETIIRRKRFNEIDINHNLDKCTEVSIFFKHLT